MVGTDPVGVGTVGIRSRLVRARCGLVGCSLIGCIFGLIGIAVLGAVVPVRIVLAVEVGVEWVVVVVD